MTNSKKKTPLNIASALKRSPIKKGEIRPVEIKTSQVVVVPKKTKVEVTGKDKLNNKNDLPKKLQGNKKEAEYFLFIEWVGTPLFERTPKTQKELAKQIRTTEAVLSNWKKRKGFWDRVATHTRRWGQNRTSDLVGALYKQMLTSHKPTGRDFMVWLQYIERFNPKILLEDETPLERKYDPEQRQLIATALLNAGLANQSQLKAFASEAETNDDNETD